MTWEDADSELDISDEAQDARRAAMAERLLLAGVETVSELSPFYGRAILFDGQPAIVIYEVDGRFSARYDADGRRPWGATADIVDADGVLTYASPECV